jgi:hypothetical protein
VKSQKNFNPIHKREQLPFKSQILLNPESFFISKNEITLKYTQCIRKDIKTLMKEKNIGWTKLTRILLTMGYRYNPSSLQNQVDGNTKTPQDIKYFVPICIMLNSF